MSKLGKLRRWAGGFVGDLKGPEDERHDRYERPFTVDDDLKALDEDLALRKKGLEKLLWISDAYGRSFFKRKDFEDPQKPKTIRKMNPAEALGLSMVAYGEQHGDTPFGRGMIKYGTARCEIYAAYRQFGKIYNEDYHTAFEQALRQVKDVQTQKKALEKMKVQHEAVMTKMAKSKKEKERDELEEEAARTGAVYDSMLEEVQTKVIAIEDLEATLLEKTMQLIDDELDYLTVHRETLTQLKDEMNVSYESKQRFNTASKGQLSPVHTFSRRPSSRSIPSLSSASTPPTPLRTQARHLRHASSTLSAGKRSPITRGRSFGDWSELANDNDEPDDDEDDDPILPRRQISLDSDSDGSKGPGRQPSIDGPLAPLKIPPIPPRTPPRVSPVASKRVWESRDGFRSTSEPEEDSAPDHSEESDGGEPFGDHRTPIEEKRDPIQSRFGGATAAPSVPPRRTPSMGRMPPPTPPRRTQSYNTKTEPSSKLRKEQTQKSPFDTTDDSDG